jgi:hypothetical protein
MGCLSSTGGSGPGLTPVFCSSVGTPARADLPAGCGPVTFPGWWMQINLWGFIVHGVPSRPVVSFISCFMVFFLPPAGG